MTASDDRHTFSDETEEPSPRSFGLTFAVVFAIYGLWPLWKTPTVRPWALGVAALLAAIAWLAPRILTAPSRAWLKVGLLMHRVVNPVVMAVLFYGAVTPFGTVWRWLNPSQALRFRPDPDATTYWIDRTDRPGSMNRQF